MRLDLGDVAGLRALRTVNDLEFDRLAFLERAEAVALNRRVVDEYVTTAVALDETISLGVVEPLDLACDAHRSLPACCDAGESLASVNQPRRYTRVALGHPSGAHRSKKKDRESAAFPLRRQARPASVGDDTGLSALCQEP